MCFFNSARQVFATVVNLLSKQQSTRREIEDKDSRDVEGRKHRQTRLLLTRFEYTTFFNNRLRTLAQAPGTHGFKKINRSSGTFVTNDQGMHRVNVTLTLTCLAWPQVGLKSFLDADPVKADGIL